MIIDKPNLKNNIFALIAGEYLRRNIMKIIFMSLILTLVVIVSEY